MKKHVAIISANPNLKEIYTPQAHHDSVIAVNAAAGLFPCEFWSCGDARTFARVEPVSDPPPVLFTLTASDSCFTARRAVRERYEASQIITWTKVKAQTRAPAEAANWSVTAALMIAVDMNATVVDVYGHYYDGEDENNTVDCAGFELPKRIETRPRVMADWNITKQWAETRGVRVLEINEPNLITEGVSDE